MANTGVQQVMRLLKKYVTDRWLLSQNLGGAFT